MHHISILAVLKIGLVEFTWYPTSTNLQVSMHESIAPKHHVQYCLGRLLAVGQLFGVLRSWMGWWGRAKRKEFGGALLLPRRSCYAGTILLIYHVAIKPKIQHIWQPPLYLILSGWCMPQPMRMSEKATKYEVWLTDKPD